MLDLVDSRWKAAGIDAGMQGCRDAGMNVCPNVARAIFFLYTITFAPLLRFKRSSDQLELYTREKKIKLINSRDTSVLTPIMIFM